MKVEVYIMARNESRMVPYLMRHYGRFAKVIFIESNSTDNTVELAHSLGAEIHQYETKDELDDQIFINIKNNCWAGSTADWIFVVDADEFIYHPDLIGVLSRSKATIIQPSFHNMFSEEFPTTKGQIYEEVKMGTEDGGIWKVKPIIFKPSEIKTMNWHPGSHFCSPIGNIIIDSNSGIKILHMRFLSREYTVERYYGQKDRISKDNLDKGWAVQYQWDRDEIDKIFDEAKPNLKQIV